jgi:hypothetical protein
MLVFLFAMPMKRSALEQSSSVQANLASLFFFHFQPGDFLLSQVGVLLLLQ